MWRMSKWPVLGKYFHRKFNNEFYQQYDFESTIMWVLDEIKEQKDSNIVFQIIKSKRSIISEIDHEITFFKERLSSYDQFSMSAVQTRKAAHIMLNHQRKILKHYKLRGELTPKEFEESINFLKGLDTRVYDMELKEREGLKN